MQLLKIAKRMFNGCSQVHKPENPFKEMLLAYEQLRFEEENYKSLIK
jgi:hypothetical protein